MPDYFTACALQYFVAMHHDLFYIGTIGERTAGERVGPAPTNPKDETP
jgi:hypothetical protein